MITAASDLAEQFSQWAQRAGATVERVPDAEAVKQAITALAERLAAKRITATPDAARFGPTGTLTGGPVADVADADLGLSVALLAVAETGSVLLGSNRAEDRLVGILALNHVVIVPAARLVRSLDDAASELRRLTARGNHQLRYVQFVTGPSRTADIERVLTIGVQGPQAMHLVVIATDT